MDICFFGIRHFLLFSPFFGFCICVLNCSGSGSGSGLMAANTVLLSEERMV